MNLNVRVTGALADYVKSQVEDGDYENVSEYVRDLIRREKAAAEEAAFQRLKTELKAAFEVPDEHAVEWTPEDVFHRRVESGLCRPLRLRITAR